MRKKYAVKEIYYTLQGEGAHSGRAAIFLRFAGCNLWSGLEKDRSTAICQFCDTDFWGTDGENGGKYSAEALADKVIEIWQQNTKSAHKPYVVCTGGEPLLQLNTLLINTLHASNIEIAIETNGTIEVPKGVDWICMSPKANTEILVTKGNELKLVFPQLDAEPDKYIHLDFDNFYLQPMDNENQLKNIQACIAYCSANPQWKLSLQTHKLVGLK
jgi:7-carboxy-7-deazaguanine synthase